MPRYRAVLRGQTPDGTWRQPGEQFETDAPKGAWMELIEDGATGHDGKKGKVKPAPAADD